MPQSTTNRLLLAPANMGFVAAAASAAGGGNGTQGISRAPRWLLNIVGIELWFKGNIIRNLC